MQPSLELDTIELLLKKCVVRIPGRGTGFFVAPGKILTCSHLFDHRPVDVVSFTWKRQSGMASVSRLRTNEAPSLADLALLTVSKWAADGKIEEWLPADAVNHPCVTLTSEAVQPTTCCKRGDALYVFGHPEGSFELNGEEEYFQYGASNQNNDNTWTITITGNWVRTGFSGSPVLNLRTGQVIGVLAIKIGESGVAAARAIAACAVFQGFPPISSLQKEVRERDTHWISFLPGPRLWTKVGQQCKVNAAAITKEYKTAGDDYYVTREIERDFAAFLASDRSAMAIVGQSGMGKTTLVARLLCRCQEAGHLAAMFPSTSLPPDLADVEPHIAMRLCGTDMVLSEFWELLDEECQRRARSVVLFIDAVNEYNPVRTGTARPVHFLQKLDERIWAAHDKNRRIKFVITCRPETWNKGVELAKTDFTMHAVAYFQASGEIAHHLSRFSESESLTAYEKYQAVHNILTPYSHLSELAKYLFGDPLLLSLAGSVYHNREIPAELDTGEVFAEYYKSLDKECNRPQQMLFLVQAMVAQMFVSGKDSPDSETIQRDAITRDMALSKQNASLFNDLDFSDLESPGFALKQRNVLREWKSPTGVSSAEGSTQIRFAYDRFTEYLLSKALRERIDKRVENGEALKSATVSVVRLNLSNSQRMNTVLGALQQLLILLLKEHPKDYAAILQEIASIDAQGMSLVISVLARTARTPPNGFAMLQTVLAQLAKNESSVVIHSQRALARLARKASRSTGKRDARNSSRRFPFIDAVYRVLRNEEYRLWLRGRGKEEQDEHLRVLYDYFAGGFRYQDEVVSAAAIQYLFFLWQSREYLDDADAMTTIIVNSVEPLSLRFLVNMGLGDPLFLNLVLLFFLVLGEIREGPAAGRSRDAACRAIQRLRLGNSQILRALLDWGLARSFLYVFRAQPHAVSAKAVYAFFSNHGRDREALNCVLSFLDGSRTPELAQLRTIAGTENGILLQMLTFALSSWYERSADDIERRERLEVIEKLFFEEERFAKAEYCASLSLYHINYFGSHATSESMGLMGRMASEILAVRKGYFHLAGKLVNFNIVGTYGRALRRNGSLTANADHEHEHTRALQYAIDALASAKKQRDAKYYKYVCDNIGLLGILIEPSQVFDVITFILSDIPATPEGGNWVFSATEDKEVRNQTLQSLANIRTLYRAEVDRYLLDALQSPDLYAHVANLQPEFDMATLYSWTFEQLMFRSLTEYYQEVGAVVVSAFRDGAACRSVGRGVQLALGQVIDRLREIN